MKFLISLAVGSSLLTMAATAQTIAPTRTFGAPLPVIVPPREGIRLLPQAKVEPVPADGAGVAKPGLLPIKPLVPYVTRQDMPMIAGRPKRALAADDGDGDLPERKTYGSGYGLSWYDQPPTDTTRNVKVPIGVQQPDAP